LSTLGSCCMPSRITAIENRKDRLTISTSRAVQTHISLTPPLYVTLCIDDPSMPFVREVYRCAVGMPNEKTRGTRKSSLYVYPIFVTLSAKLSMPLMAGPIPSTTQPQTLLVGFVTVSPKSYRGSPSSKMKGRAPTTGTC
jgi:hypothetical protein